MKRLLLAFQFLTIFPVKVRGEVSEEEIGGSAVFFPVVGAFQGALISLAILLSLKLFSQEITAGIILLLLIITNGGFHLDGLADTFDALAVKSTGVPEIDINKRLEVMKDSTTGAIGVVAIVITLLLQFIFLKDILAYSIAPVAASLLFFVPVFSRWAMVPAMHHGVSARRDGLGKIFINNTTLNNVAKSTVLLIVIFAAVAKIYISGTYGTRTIKLFLMLFVISYLFSFGSVKFFDKKFDGLTGDNLGAISEISGILILGGLSIWLRHSF